MLEGSRYVVCGIAQTVGEFQFAVTAVICCMCLTCQITEEVDEVLKVTGT